MTDCPDIQIVTDHSVVIGKYTTHYGAEFDVRCQPGYRFMSKEHAAKSEVRVKCLENGKWNVLTSPTCEGKMKSLKTCMSAKLPKCFS